MAQETIIRAALFTPGPNQRWGLPMLLEGKPGTGKTSKIAQTAWEWNFWLETVISSLREPSDFIGMPFPVRFDHKTDHKGLAGRVDYLPPAWAVKLMQLGEAERGIAFFDEINTAPPSVQAALLRVIIEGVVGDVQLPPGVRFLAAMNSTEDAAGGWDLAPPLANRFGHLAWDKPSAKEWSDWLLGATSGERSGTRHDAVKEETRVMKEWASQFAKASGLVASFIQAKPDLLLKMPTAGDENASKAWPSPRTWDMATRALASSAVHDLNTVEANEFMAAFVGAPATKEFYVWSKAMDLPDPALLLDGKIKFEHDPQRLDRTMAIFSACSALVAPENAEKRQTRVGALWKMLGAQLDSKDIIVPAARVLCRAKVARGYKEAEPVLAGIQPVLRAAGITAA